MRTFEEESKAKTYQLLCTGTHVWQTLENGKISVFLIPELTAFEIPSEHNGAVKSALIVEFGDQKQIWTGDTNGYIMVWKMVTRLQKHSYKG